MIEFKPQPPKRMQKGSPLSAREWNKLVSGLKALNMGRGAPQLSDPASVRFTTTELVEPFQILEITGSQEWQDGEAVYECRKYQANQTPTKAFLINGANPVIPGPYGEGTLPLFGPTMVDTGGVPSLTPGDIVGPTHDSFVLQAGKPGFLVLGSLMYDNTDGFNLVIPMPGNCVGQGTAVTGQAENANPILLDNVTFDAGLDCWDGTSDFGVANVFSDKIADGLLIQFKWQLGTAQFVVTDAACP